MSGNVAVTPDELKLIRQLDDFDLTMLLSEVAQHGWQVGRQLLPIMVRASASNRTHPA